MVAPVPPLATTNVPLIVIVPLVVIGPPLVLKPVVPPATSTEVTVPLPPPPPVVNVMTPFPLLVTVPLETFILVIPKASTEPPSAISEMYVENFIENP